MQYKSSVFSSVLLASALAAYVPSEPWSTLTPSSPSPTGAVKNYANAFGIAVVPLPSSAAANSKRDVVSQIGDGQIQATTKTAQVISQIGDGQIQASTQTTEACVCEPTKTAQVVSQIGDGQIQATTATAQVVSQIGDGQIQATTKTAQVISQIGDGQIQATTQTPVCQCPTTTKTAQVVSQIGDGQIQATTATTNVVSQITDGQVQATGKTTTTLKSSTSAATTSAATSTGLADSVACKSDENLSMTLVDGQLIDSAGRIGSIVANRQFQFDGPPPQAGAIYAAGWSITTAGNLAIGSNDIFYQCLSGSFYNLYDESIGAQCIPIHLEIVDLVDC